jgi:hypothetical protein
MSDLAIGAFGTWSIEGLSTGKIFNARVVADKIHEITNAATGTTHWHIGDDKKHPLVIACTKALKKKGVIQK